MIYKVPLWMLLKNHIINYPTPNILGYQWSFGVLSGLCLVIQILSGLVLSMHYLSNAYLSFDYIEYIMRDVNFGWLLKLFHANGASFFFIAVYIYIGRSIYFKLYNKLFNVWVFGAIIYFVLMAIAFMGYVLSLGQMSLWGATVITNLFSAIPIIGKSIVLWLWGGFSIDTPTLMRFYTLHYSLPLIFFHLILLHRKGSSSSLNNTSPESMKFFPYFFLKDLFSFLSFLFFFILIIFFIQIY